MPDNFWQPAAADASTNPTTSPGRDRSLAAARDAAMQSTQLSSAREAVAAEREEIARRQRELAAREQALSERERQIAEQRRIMGEEYRLMRQAQSARSAAATSPARSSITLKRSNHVDPSGTTDRELTLWQRLHRLLNWSPAVRS
jgi:hypothetical protein